MRLNFVWLFIVVHMITLNSADPVRPKRDLTRIQNIIKWLLGINDVKLIETVPLVQNERDTIYTGPSYQKLLVRTIPRMDINENIRHILTDGLYPGKTLRPVQRISNYPTVYSNYQSALHDYADERAYGYYRYNRPMYPTYGAIVPPLCPISVTTLQGCDYGGQAIITETRQPLPKPPMYIQNRMREVIINRPIPAVQVQKNILMPPPSQRKVTVTKYPLIDDRITENKKISNENSTRNAELLQPIPTLRIKFEAGEENKVKTNEIGIKNKVRFDAPVQTKYKYKMIYHNQPDKSTVMEMNSMQTQTTKCPEETSTIPITKNSEQINNPGSLKYPQDKVPADYIFVPPVSSEMPPPGIVGLKTVRKPVSDYYSADASENIPIVAINDTPHKNYGNEKPTRVIVRRRKLQSRPENNRGDIPGNYS